MKIALILLSMSFLAHSATYVVGKRSLSQTVYPNSDLIIASDDNANALCVRENFDYAKSMTTAKASSRSYISDMGFSPKIIEKVRPGSSIGVSRSATTEDMESEILVSVECEKVLKK